jgi:hypothetical protein
MEAFKNRAISVSWAPEHIIDTVEHNAEFPDLICATQCALGSKACETPGVVSRELPDGTTKMNCSLCYQRARRGYKMDVFRCMGCNSIYNGNSQFCSRSCMYLNFDTIEL